MSAHQTLLCRYHYDPLDRLGGKAQTGEAATQLFYCKSRLATQIQGALRTSILQTDDHLLGQQHGTAAGRQTALLATDRQRSVLQTAQSNHQYTAYGYQAPDSGLASLLGFNGERRDAVTGHYLLGNGYRAFNPVLMRFNSQDSLSPFGRGGLNAYAYCQGDPVNYVDPDGHMAALFSKLMLKRAAIAAVLVTSISLGTGAIAHVSSPDSDSGLIVGAIVGVMSTMGAMMLLARMPNTRINMRFRRRVKTVIQAGDVPPAYQKVMHSPTKYPPLDYEILPPYRPRWRHSADPLSLPFGSALPSAPTGKSRAGSLPLKGPGMFLTGQGQSARGPRRSIESIAFDLRSGV